MCESSLSEVGSVLALYTARLGFYSVQDNHLVSMRENKCKHMRIPRRKLKLKSGKQWTEERKKQHRESMKRLCEKKAENFVRRRRQNTSDQHVQTRRLNGYNKERRLLACQC